MPGLEEWRLWERSVFRDGRAAPTEVVVDTDLQRLCRQFRVFIGKKVKPTARVRSGRLASEIVVIIFDLGAPAWSKHVFEAPPPHPALAAYIPPTAERT